jgi:predicted PurR-regulated permease PerM
MVSKGRETGAQHDDGGASVKDRCITVAPPVSCGPMSEPVPLLSPAQRKLVGFALGFGALCAIAALLYFMLAGAARFIATFSGVIWPLAAAGIMALVLRPLVDAFEKKLKLRRLSAVILLFALFMLFAAALLFTFVPAIIAQFIDFVAYLPDLWRHTLAWGETHFPEWIRIGRQYMEHPAVKSAVDSLSAQGKDLLTHIAPTLKSAGAGLFGFFGLAASVAVLPVYLFFFLLSRAEPTRSLGNHLPFLKPEQRADVVFLVREFIGILVAFFRGQLLIGLIMGVLLALGFSIAGLKFGLALGLMIGLLNVIPYLGTILGLSIALPLALLQQDGGPGLLGACLAVFVAVQAIEGWFLTPRIMGQQTGLHPVAIIVAVFFWGQALGGVLGMMLAVPLTAFLVTAWRLIRRKYFVET